MCRRQLRLILCRDTGFGLFSRGALDFEFLLCGGSSFAISLARRCGGSRQRLGLRLRTCPRACACLEIAFGPRSAPSTASWNDATE